MILRAIQAGRARPLETTLLQRSRRRRLRGRDRSPRGSLAGLSTRMLRSALFLGLLLVLLPSPAGSGEIILPSPALERDGPIRALYRTPSRATGKGTLTVKWTDGHGRLVERRNVPFELRNVAEVAFELDLRRAVAMRNTLAVHFSFAGVDKAGARDQREEDAEVSFIARPRDHKWGDYHVIMWHEHSAEHYAILKTLGISAGMYRGQSRMPPEYLLQNDLRWYVENIATDFYSEYHRWFPDRPKNWKFLEAKRLYQKDPSSKEALKRHPSLNDPEWLKKIRDRLVTSVLLNSAYRPLFYNLGDEPGIADLAAFWDFDFSDHSLTEMRTWLKERYGTVAALNQQWDSAFKSWESVIPDTTDAAMRRADHNFSSWSDFKEWMDISFARALKVGTDAVHSADPDAYSAIEGAQIPGWGGYDYSLLTKVLDAVEPDRGAIGIVRSLNPKMVVLTTAFVQGPWEKHRVWSELLHGSRGLILWDPKSEYVGKDGRVGPRGRDSHSYYTEIRGGIGALLINSERQTDPIAIHYSQASLRTEWMLEQRPKGEAWTKRSASSEEDSSFRWLRESYCRLIEDLGRQYKFVDSAQIEHGELLRSGYRVLILPRSTALSEAEAGAMREFVAKGGVLIADGRPGRYDQHARLLSKAHLSDLFAGSLTAPLTARVSGQGKAIYVNLDVVNYYQDRLLGREQNAHGLMGRVLGENLAAPEIILSDQSGNPVVGVEIHVFRNGGVRLVGLQSNLEVSVAGPSPSLSNKRFERPQAVVLTLPGERYVYDVRAARALGKLRRLTVQLDPYEPTILSVSTGAMPPLVISTPSRLRLGETGQISLSVSRRSGAALHVFHVDVVDPSGNIASPYSGNIVAPNGRATVALPLALNDKVGRWEIRVTDLLSGQIKLSPLRVFRNGG